MVPIACQHIEHQQQKAAQAQAGSYQRANLNTIGRYNQGTSPLGNEKLGVEWIEGRVIEKRLVLPTKDSLHNQEVS